MGDVYTNPPQSRNEAILNSIVEGTQYTDPPQSRIEDLLLEVKQVIEEGGHDESATRASIAPTESDSAHASKNIVVGEQFYLSDDKLYTATSAISQDDAIVVYPTSGYNCRVSDSVTGQIKAVNDNIGWTSENLMSGFEAGGINRTTGQDESSTTLSRSVGYIPVVQRVVYKFIGVENYGYRVFTFNSSKAYIESEGSLKCSNGIGYYTAPTDVSYIRLVCVNAAVPDNPEFYKADVDKQLSTKADNSVIGTVENGTNPTKSYAVNEFMVRDGAFCQVTAPVTTSSTWTEGSNYTKKSIAEVLQSLMS